MTRENFILATGSNDLKMFQSVSSTLSSVFIQVLQIFSNINQQVFDSLSCVWLQPNLQGFICSLSPSLYWHLTLAAGLNEVETGRDMRIMDFLFEEITKVAW